MIALSFNLNPSNFSDWAYIKTPFFFDENAGSHFFFIFSWKIVAGFLRYLTQSTSWHVASVFRRGKQYYLGNFLRTTIFRYGPPPDQVFIFPRCYPLSCHKCQQHTCWPVRVHGFRLWCSLISNYSSISLALAMTALCLRLSNH